MKCPICGNKSEGKGAEIFSSLCLDHVEMCERWLGPRIKEREISDNDVVVWIGHYLQVVAKRKEDGETIEMCEYRYSLTGNRCNQWSYQIVNGKRLCFAHIQSLNSKRGKYMEFVETTDSVLADAVDVLLGRKKAIEVSG